jgi:hypothetical protein
VGGEHDRVLTCRPSRHRAGDRHARTQVAGPIHRNREVNPSCLPIAGSRLGDSGSRIITELDSEDIRDGSLQISERCHDGGLWSNLDNLSRRPVGQNSSFLLYRYGSLSPPPRDESEAGPSRPFGRSRRARQRRRRTPLLQATDSPQRGPTPAPRPRRVSRREQQASRSREPVPSRRSIPRVLPRSQEEGRTHRTE